MTLDEIRASRRKVLRGTVGLTLSTGAISRTSGVSAEAASASGTVGSQEVYEYGLTLVEADPQAGFHYPYLLYRPFTEQKTARPLFVHPNNGLSVSSREELLTQLRQSAKRYVQILRTLALPAVFPGFPRTPNDNRDYVQLLALESLDTQGKRQDVATEAFPAETLHRVDRQLLNMIDDARERLDDEPYPVDDGVHMDGFSAAAAFSTRFGLLYPNRVKSISAGGGGAAPLPFSSRDGVTLPYPLGIADYQDWTGRSFNREAWTSIDQFIYVGEEDQPLPDEDPRRYRPYSDRYQDRAEEVYGINSVTEKLPTTRSVYNEVGANAEFKIYEGVGHRTTPESRQDVLQFHRRTLDAEHVLRDLFEFTTLRRSASQIEVGSRVTVTVGIRNRFSATATAVVTFYIDGENIKTVERVIEPNGSTELIFEHTFEEPGSYTLSINNQQIGEEPLAVTDPTPTPTSTPTATSTPTVQSSETTSTTGPGFGIGATLAGVAGLSYLLKREQDD